jgi:hypothetical protein
MAKMNWDKKSLPKQKSWYEHSFKHHKLQKKAKRWLSHNRKKLFAQGVQNVPYKAHY